MKVEKNSIKITLSEEDLSILKQASEILDEISNEVDSAERGDIPYVIKAPNGETLRWEDGLQDAYLGLDNIY